MKAQYCYVMRTTQAKFAVTRAIETDSDEKYYR